MKPENSSPHPKHLVICPCTEADRSSPYPISRRFILTLSSHLRLGLANGLFPSHLPHQNPVRMYPLHPTCHMLINIGTKGIKTFTGRSTLKFETNKLCRNVGHQAPNHATL